SDHVLVAGVSSAGKSTFIARHLIPLIAQAGRQNQVFFAGQLERQHNLNGVVIGPHPPFALGKEAVSIVHFNLLRPFQSDTQAIDTMWEKDAVFSALTTHSSCFDVYLCYAPDPVIKTRMEARTAIEPDLSKDGRTYPAARLQAQFSRVDQRQLLISFANAVAPYARLRKVAFSNDHATSQLSWDDFLYARPSPALEAALV
ncbi:MAG: hypothetical protein AAFY31_07050, partial [Pseudomonadota bacterium]